MFRNLFGGGTDSSSSGDNKEDACTKNSATNFDDTFLTPASSMVDLITMSPKELYGELDITSDLLTGTEFCDVTMQEIPNYDVTYMDSTSFDYLIKCNSNNHAIVDRGKESLFVNFDPLYARHEALDCTKPNDSGECDIGYNSGSALSIASPKHTVSAGLMILTTGKDKPTQVVPPVVSDVPKSNVALAHSKPALIHSMSAILAPTQVATERLINISGNTPPIAAPRTSRCNSTVSQGNRLQTLRIISQKQDQEIMQLTQENKYLRSTLQDLQHKYSRTLEDLESNVRMLTNEKESLLEREQKLVQQVNDKIMSNKQMSIVMEEYNKTISSLIEEKQKHKEDFHSLQDILTSERDHALNHLSSMEGSFNDLLTKYEKSKSVIVEIKEREKIFEQKISEYEAGLKKYENLYNNLKQITSDTLAKANDKLESTKKQYTVEITKLNATIKMHEINIASLQESLVQKTRDNEELTRICDQLINEVH